MKKKTHNSNGNNNNTNNIRPNEDSRKNEGWIDESEKTFIHNHHY